VDRIEGRTVIAKTSCSKSKEFTKPPKGVEGKLEAGSAAPRGGRSAVIGSSSAVDIACQPQARNTKRRMRSAEKKDVTESPSKKLAAPSLHISDMEKVSTTFFLLLAFIVINPKSIVKSVDKGA
jgi:hypothetical protein